MDTKTQIFNKVDKNPFESKKWITAFITLFAVLMVYVSSLVAIIMTGGKSAGDIVGLANITIVFIGTLMSIVFTGVSAVDWKAISSLENIQKTEIQNKSITQDTTVSLDASETITQNVNLKEFERIEGVNAPETKPFGQSAFDE